MAQTIYIRFLRVCRIIIISKVWLTKMNNVHFMIQKITINCQLIHNSESIITNKHKFKTIYKDPFVSYFRYAFIICTCIFASILYLKQIHDFFLTLFTVFITILLDCRMKEQCTCDSPPTNFILSSFRSNVMAPQSKNTTEKRYSLNQ